MVFFGYVSNPHDLTVDKENKKIIIDGERCKYFLDLDLFIEEALKTLGSLHQ